MSNEDEWTIEPDPPIQAEAYQRLYDNLLARVKVAEDLIIAACKTRKIGEARAILASISDVLDSEDENTYQHYARFEDAYLPGPRMTRRVRQALGLPEEPLPPGRRRIAV